MRETFEIFLATQPGLEPLLAAEAREAGFGPVAEVAGGVTIQGGWPEVWRANICLRGAGRVLARIGGFPALHLAQLDKRARKFPWGEVLRPDVPVKVEVTTSRASKIYHAGAAAERVARAITEELGAPLAGAGKAAPEAEEEGPEEAPVRLLVRIERNLVTFSVDTSGAPLHRRGHKVAVGKAPMRETMAALFLRACGYTGAEPVLDPMCGSGTFVLEAAEIASGLRPGRSRPFAFEQLAAADPAAIALLRQSEAETPAHIFHGSDRDPGAIRFSTENAARAGVAELCRFEALPVAELTRPEGPPGLVIVNPPYGERIGNRGVLVGMHKVLGERLRAGFSGWRVGLVTSDETLARATGLPWQPPGPPVPHGPLKVRLWQTTPIP
ncbi:THUMP domain-containing class I SAM-dependent RNA methyltransferase [Pseudoroseicyclus tamaricis]|uniref:Class I SAM-dependent RNA methyltransferase n=1 Tax=Pseudoroseicyclus tamaricis TaxID=2705421 RepID=A0A6B2JPW5_9RHOB|nr:class I SAM-dependent RNA methyltransferase [Pseudoroseicyclus tamaricis]NDV00158.1 class I SAM-dependent RNA methyltransferase [Pseudoroseicyclus tamaricis]